MNALRSVLARRSRLARVLGLVAGLLIVEGMARAFVWDQRTRYEPGIGYVLAPGAWLWGREGWAVSHWGPHGVRAAPDAPNGAPTVVVAGDSLTEAVHVPDEATYPYVLGELLAQEGSPARIAAVGRSGASVPDYILWRPRWDEVLAPSIIVVAVSDDDFQWDAWSPGRAHFVADESGDVRVEGDIAAPYEGARQIAWNVRQSSMALGIFPARLGEYRSALAAETPLFRAADASAVAAPTPEPHAVAPQLARLAEALGERLVVLHLAHLDPFAPRETTPVERELEGACASLRVRCVSTREALASALEETHELPYGFGQDRFGEGHLNALGHRAAAEALAPAVRARLGSD